jgi:hypothetical protein
MMKKVHYCKCRVNLSGQNCHTVIYNEFNPVTWPEVQVLMALHGDENVMDIVPVSIGEAWPSREKERLMQIYGPRVVEACFPGRAFRMELLMTGEEDLPMFLEPGAPSTKVHEPGNGNGDHPDDDDDDDDAAAKAPPSTTAVMKPGRHPRPVTPEMAKEA